MTRIMTFVGLALVGSALLVMHTITSAPSLPFYDSADLTPRWTHTVEHRIADFNLVTQAGDRIRRADLLGRPHVATFIYTRCAGVCPAMVTQLTRIQKAMDANAMQLVSFTVTPQLDSPELLAAFGRERGIDPQKWKLVTGDAGQIYGLARSSYFADDGRLETERPAAEQFLHTEKALLVDGDGRLRGIYNVTLPHEIDKLIADLGMLTRR